MFTTHRKVLRPPQALSSIHSSLYIEFYSDARVRPKPASEEFSSYSQHIHPSSTNYVLDAVLDSRGKMVIQKAYIK